MVKQSKRQTVFNSSLCVIFSGISFCYFTLAIHPGNEIVCQGKKMRLLRANALMYSVALGARRSIWLKFPCLKMSGCYSWSCITSISTWFVPFPFVLKKNNISNMGQNKQWFRIFLMNWFTEMVPALWGYVGNFLSGWALWMDVWQI